MVVHTVKFDTVETPVQVPSGTLISEAAHLAGVEIGQPCGGQGRCGRCTVQVLSGAVRRRSALRLSNEDIEAVCLAADVNRRRCRSSSLKDQRRLTTDRVDSLSPTYNLDLIKPCAVSSCEALSHLDDQTTI
jgi:ferredoxin